MTNYTPFLDVRSFSEEEAPAPAAESPTRSQLASPFLAVYEYEEERGLDPQTEDFVSFLNELYDEQFNEALSSLVDEATAVYERNFENTQQDPRTAGYQAERLLNQHFAPLVTEAEAMIRSVASEVDKRNVYTLGENEVETIVDGYRPATEINPQF